MAFFSPDPSEARLRRIERKLNRIMDHLGIEEHDELSPFVRESLDAGRKIEAIKRYREETGAGLREAKEAIDAYG